MRGTVTTKHNKKNLDGGVTRSHGSCLWRYRYESALCNESNRRRQWRLARDQPRFCYRSSLLDFWTLTLLTTIKYVVIALNADNHGEGGIFLYILWLEKAVNI